MNKGVFTISIDFEYAWGYADTVLSPEHKKLIKQEIGIANRLIKLFTKYQVPATWAIVGHLLETGCTEKNGRIHSEYPEKIYTGSDLDWFHQHVSLGEQDDRLWFDTTDVIKAVQDSVVSHEIGSHSYAHILYGAPNIKTEAVETDIASAKRIHSEAGLPFETFIFPRNQEGYHERLRQAGLTCFRGESKFWYMHLPGPLRRLARLVDYYLPTVRTVLPIKHESGLINLPDSLLLLGRNGLRSLVLPRVMKAKIQRGLQQAVDRKEIFHLWFHPSNFSYHTDTQFEIFEYALRYATKLQTEGKLEIRTMGEIAKDI